jgi:hypothetical protein
MLRFGQVGVNTACIVFGGQQHESKTALNDLYKMIAHIYNEQNAQRCASTTFAHFVEVRGPLSAIHAIKTVKGCHFDAILAAQQLTQLV